MERDEGPMQAVQRDIPEFLAVGAKEHQRRLAFLQQEGAGPAVVWLGGFRSDMRATKAESLSAWARDNGRACLRFDYSGHGESEGDFGACTISQWLEDALAMLEARTQEPVVLVGSSMGGWLSLLAARKLPPGKLAGLVLIAPAVDFTESLMWAQFTDTIKRQIMETGLWLRHSEYSPEPYPISRALIENGRGHLLFGAPLRTHCPVHILQGMRDPDVPWQHALKLVEHLPDDEVTLTLVNDGDHRLSREQDIARLIAAVAAVSAR
jgi:pimeloyl-ACP methyl ester carboxylesterase